MTWKEFHSGSIGCLSVDIYQIYHRLVILSTILELLEVVENRYLWAKIFEKKQKEVGMKRKDGNIREQDVRWPGGRYTQ